MQINHQKQQREFSGSMPTFGGGRAGISHTVTTSLESTVPIWHAIASIPGVRSWRILRDVAFLATSLPLALAAFIVAIVGGTLGLSLSVFLIGIPILIWTVGLTLRFADHERERLRALLDIDLGSPRYPANNGENAFRHLLTVARSPQIRGDLLYMLLLFPISIIEFALVLLPLDFIVSPLMHLAFGSLFSVDVLGITISSRPEALLFIGLGLLLVMPMLILMNMATNLHASFARRMLGRR